jgi:hypothetical protein
MIRELTSNLCPAQVEEVKEAIEKISLMEKLSLKKAFVIAAINDATGEVAVTAHGVAPKTIFLTLDLFKGNADFEALEELLNFLLDPAAVN